MDAMENLLTRRSVRTFKPDMVPREVLEQIAGIASEAAREKGKYVKISVNYSQSVMELAVTDYQSAQEICREEANEGELTGD